MATYNVQFHEITAHFTTETEARNFCILWENLTGVIVGIQQDTPKTRKRSKTVTMPERSDLDRAYQARELSKDDYFAACKRIGFRDDLRFLIRVAGHDMPLELRREADSLLAELEARASKPADGKAINSIRDRYRATLPSLTIARVSWLDRSEYAFAAESEAA